VTETADATPDPGAAPTEEAVRARLDEVIDPCSASRGTEFSIVEMGLVESVEIDRGDVSVALRLTGPGCMQVPYFVEQVTERVSDLDGAADVTVTTDAGLEWTPEMMSAEARRTRRERREELAERFRDVGGEIEFDDGGDEDGAVDEAVEGPQTGDDLDGDRAVDRNGGLESEGVD
jgi:metal-sulfur cluster biosynthetic enzyme